MVEEYMKRLRALREYNDITQYELASYLGTSQTMYARYENGKTTFPIRHLVQLCELYQVSADEILGLNEDTDIYFKPMTEIRLEYEISKLEKSLKDKKKQLEKEKKKRIRKSAPHSADQ